jgi:hypothetical protein
LTSGRAHLAANDDVLALVLLDLDADLRVADEAVGQPRPEAILELPDREPARGDAIDERKRDESVRADAIDVREVGFVEDGDPQLIVGPEHVATERPLIRFQHLGLGGLWNLRRQNRRVRRPSCENGDNDERHESSHMRASFTRYSGTRASGMPSCRAFR